jgi:hemolysin activation/secretion protein
MRANHRAIVFLLLSFLGASAMADDGLPSPDAIIQKGHAAPAANIHVVGFRFEGNSAISSDRLLTVLKPFIGHTCTPEDLDRARLAVTKVYVDAGYITSGAIIPPQDAKTGVILIRVLEGKLQKITLSGLQKFWPAFLEAYRESFLKRRIMRGAGPPLNAFDLKERLELIRQDPSIKRINAELVPTTQPGYSALNVDVVEANRYRLGLDFNNRQSAEVGAEKLDLIAGDENFTGVNDTLNVRYGINTGGLSDFRYAGTKDFSVEYDRPVTIYDTIFNISYVRSDELIVETPENNLDVSTEQDNFDFGLTQGLVHRHYDHGRELEINLFVDGSYRSSLSELNGEPFGFSAGTNNGRTHVSAFRFGPQLTYRDSIRALSVRSTFSYGFAGFGSTVNPPDPYTGQDVPESRFFAWLLQTQYLRRLFNSNTEVLFRSNLQLSSKPLLPVEQFTLGGFDTARGYRENQLVRDNAVSGSVEPRVPLLEKGGESLVDIAPFTDIAYGWNVVKTGPNTYPVLSSVGVGLLLHPNSHIDARIYYGHPFKYFNKGSNFQDYGIDFDILLSLF